MRKQGLNIPRESGSVINSLETVREFLGVRDGKSFKFSFQTLTYDALVILGIHSKTIDRILSDYKTYKELLKLYEHSKSIKAFDYYDSQLSTTLQFIFTPSVIGLYS